ncbi:GNAT family N-acetyltransferase [Endozoicomonas montiporae]|uniref:Acetyltransferase, GNAT family n=2 Tax=Endozoicomonas montiporae TaxID=1027273 RepID=A0A142B6S6_9GAMM|nr:GNAT family N-acetyltransferase [Endozoicomonas montiporae]AMO54452.1 acetyltransferase, GNAT family [Endozoicomonas montiporae CL-33]
MSTLYTVCKASGTEAEKVGTMAFSMESELWEGNTGGLDKQAFINAAETLLSGSGFWALLAKDHTGETVGVMTLSECAALYAGGHFGEIMEMYIEPEHRSAGVGAMLIDAARDFAKSKGWPFLEVGSPEQPKWARTLSFYKRQGFREIGPRLELALW